MASVVELQIADSEKDAICVALPLAEELLFPNPVNASICAMASKSALAKLNSRQYKFSMAEIRAISLSVSAAVIICSGQSCEYLDPRLAVSEWKRKLAPHFFSLNKLEPILGEFLAEHLH